MDLMHILGVPIAACACVGLLGCKPGPVSGEKEAPLTLTLVAKGAQGHEFQVTLTNVSSRELALSDEASDPTALVLVWDDDNQAVAPLPPPFPEADKVILLKPGESLVREFRLYTLIDVELLRPGWYRLRCDYNTIFTTSAAERPVWRGHVTSGDVEFCVP